MNQRDEELKEILTRIKVDDEITFADNVNLNHLRLSNTTNLEGSQDEQGTGRNTVHGNVTNANINRNHVNRFDFNNLDSDAEFDDSVNVSVLNNVGNANAKGKKNLNDILMGPNKKNENINNNNNRDNNKDKNKNQKKKK